MGEDDNNKPTLAEQLAKGQRVRDDAVIKQILGQHPENIESDRLMKKVLDRNRRAAKGQIGDETGRGGRG